MIESGKVPSQREELRERIMETATEAFRIKPNS